MYYDILTSPKYNVLRQQQMLLATEGVDIRFTDDAIKEMAKITKYLNYHKEDIGARRLHSIVEKVVEDYSYFAARYKDQTIIVDVDDVHAKTQHMLQEGRKWTYVL